LRGRWGALGQKLSAASFGGGLSGFQGRARCEASAVGALRDAWVPTSIEPYGCSSVTCSDRESGISIRFTSASAVSSAGWLLALMLSTNFER